ncbi:MAG TPA: carboxylesterase family protein [Bryobacteraceae bacterium]|nr:carboxylesterase family protein [Bryobacteraceae bacterium]
MTNRMRWTLLLAAAMPLAAMQDPVRVAGGLVSGAPGSNPEVRVYKGIPFAAPPIGDLRWKPPKPAPPWQGVRRATQFGAACMQLFVPRSEFYYSEPEPTSEDCLYLNVWTAAKSSSERRPVMVWIFGGAQTRGSGSWTVPGLIETRLNDGEALAKKGVVLVTLNHRLNIFGFLAHPELTKESDRGSSGNYAFLDQIAALEWVQNNIAAFGGDPKRVTLFGQSAGSFSVNYLMASPLAKGLFQRAIGESGGVFGGMRTREEAEAAGVKFANSIGAESLQALRAKSAADLLKASAPAGFTPFVDGWMLPQDVYAIFSNGKQNDVPLIAGYTSDEATPVVPWPADGSAAWFIEQARSRFGEKTDEFLKIYPARSVEEAKASHYASNRDRMFGWHVRTWVRMQTKTGKSKAYLYYFSRVPPGSDSARYGAFHSAELPYVFAHLDPPRPWEDIDRKLSQAMSSYWVNFAASGDPNGKDLPKWTSYDKSGDTALEFGNSIQSRSGLNQAGLDFLDGYFAGQRQPK